MKKALLLVQIVIFCTYANVFSQSIIYTEPDRDDLRNSNFEIIGKMNGSFLIYKNYRDLHYISVYDNDLKLVHKTKLDSLPDRIFNADFLAYSDYCYMFYQYQKRNVIYCVAQKINSDGRRAGAAQLLDTTNIGFAANNKIYSIINSDDKKQIMIFKINTKNDKQSIVTTVLFNNNLNQVHKSRLFINMPERNDFLTEFQLNNEGDVSFLKASGTSQNDNIIKLSLLNKTSNSDEINAVDLNLSGLYFDDARVKIDNENKHIIITSFYAKQRRGNIEGLYAFIIDQNNLKSVQISKTIFSDEFRSEAKGESSIKLAFNDYFLKQIIMRKDGGYIIAAESAYTSSRGGNTSRWDYLYGYPYLNATDYYYGSGFGAYYYPWNRFNNGFNNFNNITRYYADNVAVMSFGNNGKLEWSNIIHKSQFDDNTDDFIGYGMMNTGDKIHFLFNQPEKRQNIFSDQSITPDGQLTRNPTLKNLDKGYEFMPRQAKQTGLRQIIIPCMYRGYICFAKLDI